MILVMIHKTAMLKSTEIYIYTQEVRSKCCALMNFDIQIFHGILLLKVTHMDSFNATQDSNRVAMMALCDFKSLKTFFVLSGKL